MSEKDVIRSYKDYLYKLKNTTTVEGIKIEKVTTKDFDSNGVATINIEVPNSLVGRIGFRFLFRKKRDAFITIRSSVLSQPKSDQTKLKALLECNDFNYNYWIYDKIAYLDKDENIRTGQAASLVPDKLQQFVHFYNATAKFKAILNEKVK